MTPCFEKMVFKVTFGNALDRSNIKQIAQSAIGGLEGTDRIHKLLVLLRNPIRGLELVVGDLSDPQLDDDIPADPVTGYRECYPLEIIGAK